MTNPIWVVKVRMFTTRRDNPQSYRGLWGEYCLYFNHARSSTYTLSDGLRSIYRTEGVPGLYRGTLLALFGVSNGAIQFMAYEKMKAWGFERKRRRAEREGSPYDANTAKLVCIFGFLDSGCTDLGYLQSNIMYTVMSISSKLLALAVTYPYQVVRS